MNFKTLAPTLFIFATLCGCYTRFASIDNPQQLYSSNEFDSLLDSSMASTQVDTIIYKEKEICVWERDLSGFPFLRCFPSYYPRDWFFYNNSPWWYRNSSFWHDYKKCPRYYYFDPDCGCCKYYKFYPYRSSWGGNNEGGGNSNSTTGSPNRSRNVGGTGFRPVHQGQNTLPKTTEPPANTNSQPAPNRPQRSRGSSLPNAGTVNQQNETNTVQKRTASVPKPEPVINKPAIIETLPDTSGAIQKNRPKRNSRW